MEKKFVITILSAVILGISTIAYADNVTIEANKQNFNIEKKMMSFEGNVKVKYNDITVNSPKAIVKTNSDGKPEVATFFPKPQAVRENNSLRTEVKANIFKLSLLNNNAKAEGGVNTIIFENKKPIAI